MKPKMEKAYRSFCKKRHLVYADGNGDVGWGDVSNAFLAGADHEREECATRAKREEDAHAEFAEQAMDVPGWEGYCRYHKHETAREVACGIKDAIRARGQE